MQKNLLEYLKRLENETIGALSGNSNGVLEISIGLKKDRPEDNKSDQGYMIRHSRLVIMLNKWEMRSSNGELLANNETPYLDVEKVFIDLEPEKITEVKTTDGLAELTIEAEGYTIRSVRSSGFEMLVHDFDHQATLAVNDKGEVAITSKNKEFPF
jgi:hypothetical protein